MGYTVKIDKQSCLSSGRCMQAAPGAFALDEDQLADVGADAAALAPELLREIARGCPAYAILLYDESGAEVDPHSA